MKTKSYIAIVSFLMIVGIAFNRCSELRDSAPVSPSPGLDVHPEGWTEEDSTEFHGSAIRDKAWDLQSCQECHGDDYKGGISEKSCLLCHSETPEDCTVCHGGGDNLTGAPPQDLAGNTDVSAKGVGAHSAHLGEGIFNAGVMCESCHVVPQSFSASGHADTELPAEISFSDLAIRNGASPQWDGETCANTYCHGQFDGGNQENTPIWTQVDGTQSICGSCHGLPPTESHPQGNAVQQCILCHGAVVDENNNIANKRLHVNGAVTFEAHPEGWVSPESPDFHGLFVRSDQWDLSGCRDCHGQDYSGGIANLSCLTCHPATPEGCIVCHGGVDNLTGSPPADIDGNRESTVRGVGAHTSHVAGSEFSDGIACASCHSVPVSLDVAGHTDSDLPAEIAFSGLALEQGASPQWDGQACSGSYCHGNFEGGNAATAPLWTVVDGTQAACGTCHVLPPGGPHPQGQAVTQCRLCHVDVVGENNNIIDKSRHIDGIVDVVSHPDGWVNAGSPDFHGRFIRNNDWNLAYCQQCHGDDYSGGLTNTSCLTCHPATPEDCIVCHGGVDNQTGAPPEDIDGNSDATVRGVGAHTAHLTGEAFSSAITCQSCHVIPGAFSAQGHADSDLPAELQFSDLALVEDASPEWDGSANTCRDSYCHGNWSLPKGSSNWAFVYSEETMRGGNDSPTWTQPGDASCGSCHGLPPAGHNPEDITRCGNCHTAVMGTNGDFIDKTKHINGMVNVFNMEYPMF